MQQRPRPMTTADQVKLDRLASLRQEPEAQRAYAMQLVQTERSLAVVGAALDLLLANPSADARPALLKRYAHLAAEGPRRDAGGLTRARIIDGLRQFGRQDDGDLFEKAACTYEHSLIDGQEIGQMVRSAGLMRWVTWTLHWPITMRHGSSLTSIHPPNRVNLPSPPCGCSHRMARCCHSTHSSCSTR